MSRGETSSDPKAVQPDTNAELRARLAEAEEMLRAIRRGEVDAIVVEGDSGPRIYTLQGLDAVSANVRGEMLAQVSDAVIALDGERRITFFNAAAERLYGMPGLSVLGRSIDTVYTTRWLHHGDEAVADAHLRERREWRGEVVHIRHDGHALPVESSMMALLGDAGQISGVLTINRDISERQRAEQAVHESEERLRLATDAAEIGIWTWYPGEDRVTWENAWPYKVVGLPATVETMTAAKFRAEFVHPDDCSAFDRAVAATVETGATFHFEGRFARADGELRSVEFKGKLVPAHNTTASRVLGTVQDITERRRADQILRENEYLFGKLLEQAPHGVYVIDSRFRVQRLNAVAAVAFASVQPVIGRDFGEVIRVLWGAEVGGRLADIFRRTLETGERYVATEFSEQRHDLAVEQSYDWEAQRITLPDGRYGVVCYFQDVTERRRAEEQTKLLMGEINHRAKNLLGVVQAVARQTARGADPDTFVSRLSDRLNGLAVNHDLLVKSQWQGVDVADLVRAQLAHFKDLLGSRVLISGPSARLKPAAAQGIGMALHELATNAAKYGSLSSTVGRVHISWRVGDGQFTMQWLEQDGPVVISPKYKGFGQTVIGTLAEAAVGGRAEIDYRRAGFAWTLTTVVTNALEG